MTLQSWLANRWIIEHEPSAEEIAACFLSSIAYRLTGLQASTPS